MTDSWRNYRHSLTGLVQRYHPRVASADPNLIEVGEDAKPLAFTPIPAEAVEDYLASRIDDAAETVADTEEP